MQEPEGAEVLRLAQQESRSSGHNYVGPEQILLALINIGHGLAFTALKDVNVTLEVARSEVRMIIPDGADQVVTEIPFTDQTKRVLELSWDEARQFGHNYIGSEHLLLALVRDDEAFGESIAIKTLQNLGVKISEFRRHVLKLVTDRDYFVYLKQAGLLRQYHRVRTCCRILGLNVDELTIDSVEQAWRIQLSTPGVHHDLAIEMTIAKDTIVKWIEENPRPPGP